MQNRKVLIAILFVLCLLITFFLNSVKIKNFNISRIQYENMFNNCDHQMRRQTCTLMQTKLPISSDVKQVYIPQFGPVSIELYKKIRIYDLDMCQKIKDSCIQNDSSDMCQLGKALYLN